MPAAVRARNLGRSTEPGLNKPDRTDDPDFSSEQEG